MSRITQSSPSLIENILTDDCLAEIFKFSTARGNQKNLFAVSCVSKRWRNVALAHSEAWSRFRVDEDDVDRRLSYPGQHRRSASPSTVFPKTALMLERSRQHSLVIVVDTGKFDSWNLNRLASLLSPHVDRISSFAIFSRSWKHHLLLTKMFVGRFLPTLQVLCINHQYSPSQGYAEEFPETVTSKPALIAPFSNAESSGLCPNLRELALFGAFCNWQTPYAGGNLTTIYLTKIPIACRPTTIELCALLEMNKNTLTFLNIGSMPYMRGEGVVPTIELPHLDVLSLEYTMPRELSVFADHIRVPALTRLDIINTCPVVVNPSHAQFCYDETVEGFTSIVRYFPLEHIERLVMVDVLFGPEPTHLELQSGRVDHLPDTYQFFQRLRNVTSVEFRNPGKYWLQAAGYYAVGQIPNVSIMPKLEKFLSLTSDEAPASGNDTLDFLRHRASSRAPKWDHMELGFPISMKETVCASPEILLVSKTTRVVFSHWDESGDLLEEEHFMYAGGEQIN